MRSHEHLHRPQDTNNLGSTPPSSGTAAPAQGVWVIDVNASESTSITQVGLPCYDRANPLTGTKDARESHLKLMTGMNADVRPLNFRSEWDDREGKPDPYYKAAPGWTSLSGGPQPRRVVHAGAHRRDDHQRGGLRALHQSGQAQHSRGQRHQDRRDARRDARARHSDQARAAPAPQLRWRWRRLLHHRLFADLFHRRLLGRRLIAGLFQGRDRRAETEIAALKRQIEIQATAIAEHRSEMDQQHELTKALLEQLPKKARTAVNSDAEAPPVDDEPPVQPEPSARSGKRVLRQR